MRELLAVPVTSIAVGNVIEMPVFGKAFPLQVVSVQTGAVTTDIEARTTFGSVFLFTVPTAGRINRPINRAKVLRMK